MNGWMWIFFSGCMLFAFNVIYLTYPETKGVSEVGADEPKFEKV
jgi:hypothetical protein